MSPRPGSPTAAVFVLTLVTICLGAGAFAATPVAPEPWRELGDDYRKWLELSRAPVLAVREARRLAIARDFRVLDVEAPPETWPRLGPGDGVFIALRNRTAILVRVGSRPLRDGLRIVVAHIDAPALRLDPRRISKPGAMGEASLAAHAYGGLKPFQWAGLPLVLVGTVAPRRGEPVHLSIGPGEDFAVMLPPRSPAEAPPERALAEDPELRRKPRVYALVAASAALPKSKSGAAERLYRILDDRYGLSSEDLEASELFAVPAFSPRDAGLDRSLILGHGQDDRICSYAALRALLDLEATPELTAVAVLVDREELGSTSTAGMKSELFELVVQALLHGRGEPFDTGALRDAFRRSDALSADVKAAVNPLFPGVHDRKNAPTMGRGPTIVKATGHLGKRGASDAHAEIGAWLRSVAVRAGIPTQDSESGRVDEGGGGTVSKFIARRGIDVIDIGIPLLSMHAPYETSSKFDVYQASRLMRAFFAAPRRTPGE